MLEEDEEIDVEFHPCQYCNKPCKGKQCRDCHFEMISVRQGNCSDCKKPFMAIRKDGSIKKRCNDCQYIYTQTHISICPSCSQPYHAYLSDGRFFDKCYSCYQGQISKCQKCDKNAYNGYILCRQCYQESKEKNEVVDRPVINRTKFAYNDIDNETGIFKCKTLDCSNITSYSYCKDCYENYKIAK